MVRARLGGASYCVGRQLGRTRSPPLRNLLSQRHRGPLACRSTAGFSLFSRSFSKESDRKLFTGGLPRGFHLGMTMRHILNVTLFGRALDFVQVG